MALTSLNTSSVKRPGAFLGRITSAVRDTAARLSASSLQALILDVACGNGLFFASVSDTPVRFVGADLDMDLLREGKRVLADNGIENASLAQGDAGALPFCSGAFDSVFLLNTLVNITDDKLVHRFLGELMRVCKPSGTVFVDIRNRSNPYLRFKYWWHNRTADFPTRAYHRRQLDGIFSTHGFQVVSRHAVGSRLPLGAFSYLLEIRRRPPGDSG